MKCIHFLVSKFKRSIDLNKYLIVGIGNIGTDYFKTRHNLGFEALDFISDHFDSKFEKKRLGEVSKFTFKGKKIILLKPNTYVNLSGKSIRYWLNKEKINIENLMVVIDDINLPFGTIRIRTKGSDGGHNGLKNINELLDTTSYNRLRFGIGSNFTKKSQSDYVLSKWSENESSELSKLIPIVNEVICMFVLSGVDLTMSQYNS